MTLLTSQDRLITNKQSIKNRDLVFAGRIIQIKALDHIIIGDNRYFSFADAGLMEEYNINFLNLKGGKRA